jgi:preprotein translocase subunit SecE
MNKIAETYERLRGFLGEVKTELKKCAWPSRQELIDSTIVVIISVILLGAYVALSDTVSMGFIKMVIR